MAETIIITSQYKEDKYKELYPQINALVEGETDLIANMANICAALKYSMNFFWVGFYLVKDECLVLGPFQGPVACTRIQKGKGVCGMAWLKQKTLIVDDVNQFPGHIACSDLSKSEIVVPVKNKEQAIIAVLDVDSSNYNTFDEIDHNYLESICQLLI